MSEETAVKKKLYLKRNVPYGLCYETFLDNEEIKKKDLIIKEKEHRCLIIFLLIIIH